MPTANEYLRDRIVMHATYLQRYAKSESAKILALLRDEVEPELYARLQFKLERIATRGFDKSLESTQALKSLHAEIAAIIAEFAKTARRAVQLELYALSKAEAAFQAKAMADAIPAALRVETRLPAPATLRAIVNEGPINGALLKDWFKGLERGTLQAVTRQVNIGLTTGQTAREITKSIRGTPGLDFGDGALAGTRTQVSTLVRTATTQVATNARARTNHENRDIIKGEQWLATLDHKTCPVCGPRDGKVYDLGEGPRPPAHPNCRCAAVPVLKSWDEVLGLRPGTIDKSKIPVGTRASMDGQVPADLTFNQWLKGRSLDDIADVLGSKKAARLFKSGDLELSQFSTAWGKPLSLKQVMEKSGIGA